MSNTYPTPTNIYCHKYIPSSDNIIVGNLDHAVVEWNFGKYDT